MDYGNGKEALREIQADIEEGVDVIMVKPALSYMDDLDASLHFDYPICAYNVSGEYSMMKMAVEQGLMNEDVIYETLLSMERAGADMIITSLVRNCTETERKINNELKPLQNNLKEHKNIFQGE